MPGGKGQPAPINVFTCSLLMFMYAEPCVHERYTIQNSMDRWLICIFMKSIHMHVLCEYIHMYSMDMYVDTCTGQRSILMSFLQSCLPCFPEPGPSGLGFTK